jgi:hypothetical protein
LITDLTTTTSSTTQLTSMADLLAVTGPGTAVANGGEGGGYKFSPDELQEIIKEWTGIRDDLRELQKTAQRMVRVRPPGNEDASNRFAEAANNSGNAYLKHNQEMQDYVSSYIKKLQAALDSYRNTEHDIAGSANRIQGRL